MAVCPLKLIKKNTYIMSTKTPSSNPIINPYKYLRIFPNSDGTVTRLPEIPNISPIPPHPSPILTKDITVNSSNNTWARLYLPNQILDSSTSHPKLPLIVYFHGGGFILFSAASTFVHDSCVNLAIQLSVVVVSITYRLAPEHRLPAAYKDAVDALYYIKTSRDQWLTEFSDLNKCFLMGFSAGANIAYHAGLRVAGKVDDLLPLKIRGLILHQPFFGGSKRTESELRLVNDPHLPLCCNDLMWELALPMGADRNHEYCNPAAENGGLTEIEKLGWRIFVDWGDIDPLMDRQVEFIKMLEKMGLQVINHFVEGNCHGVEIVEPSKLQQLCGAYSSFISCALR